MLFPRLAKQELNLLRERMNTNKELNLILNEENTEIKTLEDISGLPQNIIDDFKKIKNMNANTNPGRKIKNDSMKKIFELLKKNDAHFKT